MTLSPEQKQSLIQAKKDLHRIAKEIGEFNNTHKVFGCAYESLRESQMCVDELLIDGDVLDQETDTIKE